MNYFVILILLAGVVFSLWKKKLTIFGALTGFVLGGVIYLGGGFKGLILLVLFFLLGTAATSFKKAEKKKLHASDAGQTTRTAGQVFANAGVAAMMALAGLLVPGHIWGEMLAGSIAAATADTLSSELGMVYGKRCFNILTFKRDERGLDGVISLEGTLIGLAGALIISLVNGFSIAVVAGGMAGNLIDSYLGASLERKGYIGNDTVNFLNTLSGALIAGLITII